MGSVIFVIAATAIIFLAIIISLASKPRFFAQVTGSAVVLVALGGLVIYGWSFAEVCPNLPLAIIRATLAVIGMFVGRNDLSAISSASIMQSQWMRVLFWFLHLCSLYATASAAIVTIGASALRRLRLWMARRGNLALIYGVNRESVAFGCKLAAEKTGAVVFVDGHPDASGAAAISGAGLVLRTDSSAVNPDMRFLRSIGAKSGKRKISLYALDLDTTRDLGYAEALLSAMEQAGIDPRNTAVTIPGAEYSMGSSLQALGEKYGYGAVNIFNGPVLAARTAMREFPPLKTITADENGRVNEDMHVLLVGFGRMGQALLRYIVMNGQACGSHFRADVFARDCKDVIGHYTQSYSGLLKNYDITFHPSDARSAEMYEFLRKNGKKLKYIMICAGSDNLNNEIAEEILHTLTMLHCAVPVHCCSYRSVSRISAADKPMEKREVYTPAVLCADRMDRMAMEVNQIYCRENGKTAAENWTSCDYFSRMSCRAFADSIPILLYFAGKTAEEVKARGWVLSQEQANNFGRTEHERWCAFHYAMGYKTMPEEIYSAREAQYLREKEATGKGKIRVGKDTQDMLHACLIPWEELDALSARENSATGGCIDYKQIDIDNVLSVAELLRAEDK